MASALAQRELRSNVGELTRIRGKPLKLTGNGADKVLKLDVYVVPNVKPITGNKEFIGESVKVKGAVNVKINVFFLFYGLIFLVYSSRHSVTGPMVTRLLLVC